MFVPTEVFIKDDTQVLKLSNTLYSKPYYRLQDEKEFSFVKTMPKSLAVSTCFMALSGQMFV